ncbi:MAG: hypothetical protein WCR02_06835 [Sphaerochaetaceae bacterium]
MIKSKKVCQDGGKGGIVQLEHLGYALHGHLAESTVMVTDKTRASTEFCQSQKCA